MTNYILIDAKTRAPVPLPYPTADGAIIDSYNSVSVRGRTASGTPYIQSFKGAGLALITEEEFMAEREVRDMTSIISLREDDD